MPGTRHLPPYAERTPAQHIESGYRLDGAQKQIYELWDRQILLLELKGRTPPEIALLVGCSEIHVRKRIPHLLEAAAKEYAKLAQHEVMSQIGTLDLLFSEARLQWERSCEDHEETACETETEGTYQEGSSEDADGGLESVPLGKFKQKQRSTRYGKTGDPRLVEQLRAILGDKRKLLRLDKDDTLQAVLNQANFTQINIQAGDGPMVPITAMTPQALAETAELLAALGMNPDGTPFKDLSKRLAEPEETMDATYGEPSGS